MRCLSSSYSATSAAVNRRSQSPLQQQQQQQQPQLPQQSQQQRRPIHAGRHASVSAPSTPAACYANGGAVSRQYSSTTSVPGAPSAVAAMATATPMPASGGYPVSAPAPVAAPTAALRSSTSPVSSGLGRDGVRAHHQVAPARSTAGSSRERDALSKSAGSRGRDLLSKTAPARTTSKMQPLGPGVMLDFSGHRFQVTEALGEGSFGIVWAAKDSAGTKVAVKEIPCKSEQELARVVAEGQLLKLVERELRAADVSGTVVSHVPLLVASDVETTAPNRWRVRLVMSQVPGGALEQFLEARRHAEKMRSLQPIKERRHQFAEACRYAGELLVQLAPTLEAFSNRVYHRDVTPRNILIEETGACPNFSLVDFGLAVNAAKWRAQEEGSGDLGGDGRYWPASAWFVFGFGTHALQRHPAMFHEYRTCLDVHSLGLTALRCLVEMLPHLEAGVDLPDGDVALHKMRALRAAWGRYWSDARRFWQPVYDAFRGSGDFEALRTAYVSAGVHRIICADLSAVRAALEDARQACRPMAPETGLAGMPALFDALLLMLQAAREGEQVAGAQAAVAEEAAIRTPPQPHGKSSGLARWSSMSTASPDSSPMSSASSGGPTHFDDEEMMATSGSSSPGCAPKDAARRTPRLSQTWGVEMAKTTTSFVSRGSYDHHVTRV
mmetsp:Transcript_36516/g.91927  ORF Transcript_36516/g.91927 Transcript_36516/m.91927 type:complete len:667 (+) Transcript_36516:43-2043(+)